MWPWTFWNLILSILFNHQESEFEEMDSTVELERGQNIFEIHIDKVWFITAMLRRTLYIKDIKVGTHDATSPCD